MSLKTAKMILEECKSLKHILIVDPTSKYISLVFVNFEQHLTQITPMICNSLFSL